MASENRLVASDDNAKRFDRDGYVPLPRLIPESLASFLYEYALKSAAQGKWQGDDAFVDTPCVGAEPFMDTLLEELLPQVEAASARSLFPTYSYLRVYKRGDILRRHSDRPACEISITLNLGYRAREPWPIWVESNGEPRSFSLNPGDALLYKGIELPHWRDPFTGEDCAQVFLHYVDRNGPHTEWKFDKRDGLAASALSRQLLRQFSAAEL